MGKLYGDVDFKLAGRAYTVRFGGLAWDEIFRELGLGQHAAVILKASADPAARDVLLRAGLATYHPETTIEDVRRLYDEIPREGETRLWAAAWEAIGICLPKMVATFEALAAGETPAAEPAVAQKTTPPRRSSKKR
jgi:hypothetical protein